MGYAYLLNKVNYFNHVPDLNNAFRLNDFNQEPMFQQTVLFLKSQEYFLNISLFEGKRLRNFLVIKEISSFCQVTAKLAENKHISDYIHSFQITLVLFTRSFVAVACQNDD